MPIVPPSVPTSVCMTLFAIYQFPLNKQVFGTDSEVFALLFLARVHLLHLF